MIWQYLQSFTPKGAKRGKIKSNISILASHILLSIPIVSNQSELSFCNVNVSDSFLTSKVLKSWRHASMFHAPEEATKSSASVFKDHHLSNVQLLTYSIRRINLHYLNEQQGSQYTFSAVHYTQNQTTTKQNLKFSGFIYLNRPI